MSQLSADERKLKEAEILELVSKETEVLSAIASDKKDNAIYYFNRPNPPQEELLGAWDNQDYKVFTYTGANRIGKTTILAILVFSTMFGFYPWSGKKIPFPHNKPRKVRIVGQSWEDHIKTVLIPTLREWWPKKRPLKTKKNNMGVEKLWVDELTGSTLEILSNMQDSDVQEGWQGDLIGYDEPPKRDNRVTNARGLIDRDGRELFSMTLLKEAWVDREVIRATLEDGRPDTAVFNVHGDIYSNVGYGLTVEGIEQFAKKLTDQEKDARLKGIPSYMSGLILSEFNRNIHIKKRLRSYPIDWILDISIDFHPSKPWAVVFLATDSRGFKYIIDEIWEQGSWKAIGESIIKRVRRYGMRVANIIIDPLSKGDPNSDLHEMSVFEKMYDLFKAYGHVLRTACKDKEGGIHLLKIKLMTENEMPALFFFDNLRRTIQEVEGWMYDENGNPSKVDDDMVECLYRLILLDTEYEEMEEVDAWKESRRQTADNCTGY